MSEPEKRRRAAKPKTKSGCTTCEVFKFFAGLNANCFQASRTRRVKCGEEKPICKRCEKAKWTCEYLLPVKKSTPQKRIRQILPACSLCGEAHGGGSGMGDSCSAQLSMPFSSRRTPEEYRYFRVFETKTAPELTGYFDNEVWNRFMLQVCHREDWIFHAIVAIGALHKALQTSQQSAYKRWIVPKQDHDGKTHHMFALQQYAKALQMMKRISGQSLESGFHNALISCLLTVCFESYMGNQESALIQARKGVDILLSWVFDCELHDDDVSNLKTLSKCHTFLGEDILSTFVLLDFQAMMFNHPGTHGHMSRKFATLPYRFSSIKEARMCLDVIVRRVQQWHSATQAQYQPHACTFDFGEINMRECSGKEFEKDLAAELEEYRKTMSEWLHAFKPLFDASRSKPGSREYLSANILMARFIPSQFLFAQMTGNTETYSDAYLSQYTQIVDLIQDVLENNPNAKPGEATFTFDNTCVLVLFIVALRCRNCAVRRRAISLLVKFPRREGLWDSAMAARVSTWVMRKEEEGLVDGFVPECARLRIVKNDFVLSERKAVFQCSTLAEGSKERVLLPEISLAW